MILGVEIETRCNLFATIQGLFLTKFLIDLIYFRSKEQEDVPEDLTVEA